MPVVLCAVLCAVNVSCALCALCPLCAVCALFDMFCELCALFAVLFLLCCAVICALLYYVFTLFVLPCAAVCCPVLPCAVLCCLVMLRLPCAAVCCRVHVCCRVLPCAAPVCVSAQLYSVCAVVRFSIEPRFRFRQAGTGVFEGDQIMLGSFNGGLWVYSHPQGRSVYADSPFRRPRREVSLG